MMKSTYYLHYILDALINTCLLNDFTFQSCFKQHLENVAFNIIAWGKIWNFASASNFSYS